MSHGIEYQGSIIIFRFVDVDKHLLIIQTDKSVPNDAIHVILVFYNWTTIIIIHPVPDPFKKYIMSNLVIMKYLRYSTGQRPSQIFRISFRMSYLQHTILLSLNIYLPYGLIRTRRPYRPDRVLRSH